MNKMMLTLAGALLLIACSHNETPGIHAGESGTAHEESESLTLYSAHYEVFAEYDHLRAGSESDFLVHVTELNEDYSPFTIGEVKVSLGSPGKEQIIAANSTGSPGIFSLVLNPGSAGESTLKFIINTREISDTLKMDVDVVSLSDAEEEHEETSTAGLIRYTKEQSWKSRFNVMEIKPQSFSRVIKASGEFMAVPGEKQFVVARSAGIVLFSSNSLVQGKYVEKGEELFTLSGKGLASDNISVLFGEAKTNYEKSKSDFLRHKTLRNENIISQKQYIETEGRFINDSIVYFSLKETVGVTGMKVMAPMGGYLHELNVFEGQYAEPGDLMVTISTNKVMLLRVDVPQQYYNVLAQVITVNFRPAYTNKVYTLEELSGKLLARGASVAENNHYLPVYFEVVNDGTLLEGAFAEIYLKTSPEPGKIVVPVAALIEEQGNYFVYVQVNGESYMKRSLVIEASDGINASVSSGLLNGEHIVSEGAMLIKTAATSSALPAHNHQH